MYMRILAVSSATGCHTVLHSYSLLGVSEGLYRYKICVQLLRLTNMNASLKLLRFLQMCINTCN
jgi:hypothetical protein